MTYKDAIDYLFESAPLFQNIGADAYKDGLSNTYLLDRHFNHPHRNYKTIHVAGTNGKGSCSHTIAAYLQCRGYKVGLYTSPHLIDFRERIRVNGRQIDEQSVIDFVEEIQATYGKDIEEKRLGFSFFELATAMAFKHFSDERVDFAVIEVGLGGRLDCTNIISPILSIITNISFDHTQFLGNTLEKIAAEKAGIIKKNTPVVVGETLPETKSVFQKKAKEMDAPIYFAVDYDCDEIVATLNPQLEGYCQEKNTKTILRAIEELSPALSQEKGEIEGEERDVLRKAFAEVCDLTGLMGRWQKIQEKPLVICDTGHNIGGWQYLARQIADTPCKRRHIVLGFVNDKDISGILQLISQTVAKDEVTFYFTQASVRRALPATDLKTIASRFDLIGNAYDNVNEAYIAALSNASDNDFVFIGGSNFIVADLLAAL